MPHSDLEQLLEREGRELMRQLLQAHLDLRTQATAEGPVVGADQVPRPHARHGTRALETIVGTVEVFRAGHGARGHETLFPVNAALNLPAERYSFGVRCRAAEEATEGSFDEVVSVLAPFGRGGRQAAGRGRSHDATVTRRQMKKAQFTARRTIATVYPMEPHPCHFCLERVRRSWRSFHDGWAHPR